MQGQIALLSTQIKRREYSIVIFNAIGNVRILLKKLVSRGSSKAALYDRLPNDTPAARMAANVHFVRVVSYLFVSGCPLPSVGTKLRIGPAQKVGTGSLYLWLLTW